MPGNETHCFWRPWESEEKASKCGEVHPPPEKWQEVKLQFLENKELREMMKLMTIVMTRFMIMVMMIRMMSTIIMMMMMMVNGNEW